MTRPEEPSDPKLRPPTSRTLSPIWDHSEPIPAPSRAPSILQSARLPLRSLPPSRLSPPPFVVPLHLMDAPFHPPDPAVHPLGCSPQSSGLPSALGAKPSLRALPSRAPLCPPGCPPRALSACIGATGTRSKVEEKEPGRWGEGTLWCGRAENHLVFPHPLRPREPPGDMGLIFGTQSCRHSRGPLSWKEPKLAPLPHPVHYPELWILNEDFTSG